MNYFVKNKIQEFEKTRNKCEKVLKISQAIEFIIMYYSIFFYCDTRNNSIVSKEIIEVIQTNFNKKSAMTSSWIRLLKESLKLLDKTPDVYNKYLYGNLQTICEQYTEKGKYKIDHSFNGLLDSFLIIRNKGIAHSNSLSEETADLYLKCRFDNLAYELDKSLSTSNELKILLCTEDKNCQFECRKTFFNDYTDDIIKCENLELEQIEFDEIYVNSIYIYNDRLKYLSCTSPFFIFRDNSFYIYSTYNSKHKSPEYCNISNGHILQVPILREAFSAKIEDDRNLINNKRLEFDVKFENDKYHNLPQPQYQKFIGRDSKIESIYTALKNRRIFLISISGIGGVGKTAIAVKCANEIIKKGLFHFTYLIWCSAKKNILNPNGIETLKQTFTNISQLLDLIIEFTGFNEFLKLTYNKKKRKVLEILALDPFLLIVDNFETLDNPKEFLAFFEEIGDVADQTKIMITSRHQLGSSEKIIDLQEFALEDYRLFVNYLIDEKFKVKEKMNKSKLESIYAVSGGLPLATEYIIGNISKKKSLDLILQDFKNNNITKDNILKFSFTETYKTLSKNEVKVLFSISLLNNPNINNVCFTTNMDEFDVADSINRLKNISFINTNNEIFSMLPLTRLFINHELEKNEALSTPIEAKIKEYQQLTDITKELTPSISFSTTPTDNISYRFSKAAYVLATQGEYAESEKYFDQANSYEPNSYHTWYYRAISERDTNNRIVDGYFEKAIKFAPNIEKSRIRYDYGKTLLNDKQYETAVNVLNKIDNYQDFKNEYFHVKGKAYFELGRLIWRKRKNNQNELVKKYYKNSYECFENSFIDSPELYQEKNQNVICIYYMSRILRFNKDYEKAKEMLDRGLVMQPHNFNLLQQKELVINALNRIN